jgi:hypothetical protein
MTQTRKPARAIDEVRAELGRPRRAASAQRRLMLIDNLRGYECSVCECRFPETRPPPGQTPVESRRLEKEHREREFAGHVCSERGWPQDRQWRKIDQPYN